MLSISTKYLDKVVTNPSLKRKLCFKKRGFGRARRVRTVVLKDEQKGERLVGQLHVKYKTESKRPRYKHKAIG
jgi:hypothetical protein